jgi:hypothetical protein
MAKLRADVLDGSPEPVIEILSPSNAVAERNGRRRLFLETGCRFWAAGCKLRLIEVSTPNGITATYNSGQSTPPSCGRGALAVDGAFARLSGIRTAYLP